MPVLALGSEVTPLPSLRGAPVGLTFAVQLVSRPCDPHPELARQRRSALSGGHSLPGSPTQLRRGGQPGAPCPSAFSSIAVGPRSLGRLSESRACYTKGNGHPGPLYLLGLDLTSAVGQEGDAVE